MKTSPTSFKIRQIVTQLREGKLLPRPEFQRRLVWTSADKIRFIDTILKGYPFPEIYVANGNVDVETGEGQQLIVDGQQRVSTIAAYFQGDPQTAGSLIPVYASLEKEQKEEFLNYDVAVRDLGSVSSDEIIEVFRRINSTKYSLNEVEINNAVYAGEFMQTAEAFATHEFFDSHKVFRSTDIKRMGDVRFVLQVMITMMTGYFNRDEMFEEYLTRFNDEFPERMEVSTRILRCFEYLDECGFVPRSRMWKKTDLFTALVELDAAISNGTIPDPLDTLERLGTFYDFVDREGTGSQKPDVGVYAKASIQASNDRINRVRRGIVVRSVLLGEDAAGALAAEGLL